MLHYKMNVPENQLSKDQCPNMMSKTCSFHQLSADYGHLWRCAQPWGCAQSWRCAQPWRCAQLWRGAQPRRCAPKWRCAPLWRCAPPWRCAPLWRCNINFNGQWQTSKFSLARSRDKYKHIKLSLTIKTVLPNQVFLINGQCNNKCNEYVTSIMTKQT